MNRPYIICHMVTSIDAKATGTFLSSHAAARGTDIYYEINRRYRFDPNDPAVAFACGRITMEGSFTGGWYPDLCEFEGITLPREDHTADNDARYYAVSFDRLGRLGWKASYIEDEDPGYGDSHIIEVLLESAPDAYLAYLRSIGVSYIFAGKEEIDLTLALEKLQRLFGINKLLLEGGSIINGAFQREELIDELSLVVVPEIAAADDKPLFTDAKLSDYTLAETKVYDGGVVWMNYRKSN